MRYVLLVSHGKFADGLKNAVGMLAGQKEEVISCGLEDGTTQDDFAIKFEAIVSNIQEQDDVVLLGDLIGGSPLTTAMNVLSQNGLLSRTLILGGMNLPMVLTVALLKDVATMESLKEQVLSEAKDAMRELTVAVDSDDDI